MLSVVIRLKTPKCPSAHRHFVQEKETSFRIHPRLSGSPLERKKEGPAPLEGFLGLVSVLGIGGGAGPRGWKTTLVRCDIPCPRPQVAHSLQQPKEELYHTPDAQGEGGGYLIAVMIGCDVFRHGLARKPNAKPGPSDVFDLVNGIVAIHLATNPLVVPDFADCASRRRLSGKRKGMA